MLIGVSTSNHTPPQSEDAQGTCGDWKEAQHSLFQLANMCLILSFLIPNSFRHYPFCLRIFLGTGYLFFSLWSGLIVCMPDVLGWSAGFFLVNLFHLSYIGYRMFPNKANKDLDDLYKKLFEPLKVSKVEYDCLVKQGYVHEMERFCEYAKEGITPCGQRISILIKGRLKVQYENMFVHCIEKNQFVDSPEYDVINRTHSPPKKHERYQVTIFAAEKSLLLSWSFDKLCRFLESSPSVSAIFHLLIGKDISDKLYQIQEMLLSDPESPLGRKFNSSPVRIQGCTPSPHSSLLNLRGVVVSGSSTSSLDNIHCFGIDFKSCSAPSRTALSMKTNTFESQV